MNGESGCIIVYDRDAEISELVTTAVITGNKCPIKLTLPPCGSHYSYEDINECGETIVCNGKVLTVVNNSCHCVDIVPFDGFCFATGESTIAIEEKRTVKFFNKDETWFVGW